MIYMGLVIDEDVRKDMTEDQIIAMHVYSELKARGYKNISVSLMRGISNDSKNARQRQQSSKQV